MKISVSSLRSFKSCRRAYELRYVEGLEPVQQSEALQTGSNYHELIEWLYKNDGCFDGVEEEWSKEQAMAVAYRKYIYPKFQMQSVEDWFTYQLSGDDVLVGRIDGIADDGYIVEHKTTSSEISEGYEYDLQWDEQILAYMLATGTRKMWYTVVRKPTIRRKAVESEEEFFDRMVHWYDEDTEKKIALIKVIRSDDEVEAFRQELIAMCQEMRECYHSGRFYKNTRACNMWGRRCEYSSICLHYDPDSEYVDFVKSKRRDKDGN